MLLFAYIDSEKLELLLGAPELSLSASDFMNEFSKDCSDELLRAHNVQATLLTQ